MLAQANNLRPRPRWKPGQEQNPGPENQDSQHLSAPSPGDDLRSKSAIRLRGQTVRSESFWEIGCDFLREISRRADSVRNFSV